MQGDDYETQLAHLRFLFKMWATRKSKMRYILLKMLLRWSSNETIENALIEANPRFLKSAKIRNLHVAADMIAEMLKRDLNHGIGIQFPSDQDSIRFGYEMTTNEFAAIMMRATAWQVDRKEKSEQTSQDSKT